MKKGIVAIILIHSLIQIIGLFLFHLNEMFNAIESIIGYYHHYLSLSLIFVLMLIGFILLGFNLNKMYKTQLTYRKFLFIGTAVAIISNYVFYVSINLYYDLTEPYTAFSWIDLLSGIYERKNVPFHFSIYGIISCSIAAIFRKRYKLKPRTNNESLDSDILNN